MLSIARAALLNLTGQGFTKLLTRAYQVRKQEQDLLLQLGRPCQHLLVGKLISVVTSLEIFAPAAEHYGDVHG